jgi:potassium efflux system protein
MRLAEKNLFLCFKLSLFVTIGLILFGAASTAFAQTNPAPIIEAPSFTTDSLEQTLKLIDEAEKLTAEQKKQAKTYTEITIASLSNAARNQENKARFATELQNAQQTLEALNEDIKNLQIEVTRGPEITDEPMREEALLQLEQDLIAKESELSLLRADLEGYDTALQSLAARQTAAPKELSESRATISDITSDLNALGASELDTVAEANRKSLQARLFFRRTQIASLEQEIAGLVKRKEITTLRRNLAELKYQNISEEVSQLLEKTGQKRFNEAEQLLSETLDRQTQFEGLHPLVAEMAAENVELSIQVVNLASEATETSKLTAVTRSRIDSIESDLLIARKLISLGNIDRRAGATLRRLSNQVLSPQALKSQISQTQKTLLNVTQQNLIAQETLRDMPIGRFDADTKLANARELDPDIVDFTVADRNALATLQVERRALLTKVANTASARITDTTELEAQQSELLSETNELKTLLAEKLLWVPSVPAISLEWPGKIIRGALEVFSPAHMSTALDVLYKQFRSKPLTVLIFVLLIGVTFTARSGIWKDIVDRSKLVGRVNADNYWHTPAVIIGCLIIALPLPLGLQLTSSLFATSTNPDPFIASLAETFSYLAAFVLLLLTWRAWDRDKSLFDAHYKLPKAIRSAINRNLRWFIPVSAVATAIVLLSGDSPTADVYEGLSLLAFIVTSLVLSLFAYRVLWTKRKALSASFGKESHFEKYRMPITLFTAGLPLITALLASLGYYDTAREFLARLFYSGWLLLLTYVVYGLMRRTVVIAQRRLALKQAIEKRDAAAKARQEKIEAEERGEEIAPPPPLDTSEIDIKAISRQSLQLLNTLVVLGFAGVMWMIWSDLLPALSIFNEVKIGSYMGQITNEAGIVKDVPIPITLWNLIQSFIILGLTFIAARNLPGFLEIFVLNRAGIDPGTRYAITTILGYIIVAVGVIIGFDKLGLQWSQLRWIVTGLSVGIGFGLQKIIANFVSGLIILFERPVRIGDYVTIGEQSGIVSKIQIRATTLADLDNREILIPNEALISERVTNWTLSNSVTRLTVPVGIAYGSDTDNARELMLESLKANPKILDNPPPQVLFLGFGDSSLDFELRVFLRNFDDRITVRHMVHSEIYKVLAKAGISIPFPQRDLNIVSQNMPLEVANGQNPKAKPRAKPKPKGA